jgi:ABC-type dipeptide/oligopeptide/nickel transport system ATPase component
MRFLSALIIIATAGFATWVLWNHTTFGEAIQAYVENGEFLTLEARYSAEHLMQTERAALLPGEKYIFQEPSLKFYPYLFMEVKYLQTNGKTKEGVILWSMVDGEMVLDTATWQKTHGFEDAINAKASQSDFLILNTLAAHNGALVIQKLQLLLNVDDNTMKKMLESALSKHLIVIRGSEVALHFQNPQFHVIPNTKIYQSLATKPYIHEKRVSKRYTQNQIETIAKAAFGKDFTVRNSKIVFLPIYRIEVLNPDGSLATTLWNALTGQRVNSSF